MTSTIVEQLLEGQSAVRNARLRHWSLDALQVAGIAFISGRRGLPSDEARGGAVTNPVRTLRLQSISAAIAAVLPVAFLAIGALRAYPFVDDVSVPASTPDDWHTYKQLALSVVRDGLSMPALVASYAGLVAADITSYGGRMVIAILPVALVSAFRLLFASELPGSSGLSSAVGHEHRMVNEARSAMVSLHG